MNMTDIGSQYWLKREDFPDLIDLLVKEFTKVYAPTVNEEHIRYQPIQSTDQLPSGILITQEAGRYKLEKNTTPRYFQWSNTDQGLRPLLFPPRANLWKANRDENNKIKFESYDEPPEHIAFLGARACDLAALALNDQHFLHTEQPDNIYRHRRERLFIIGINCTQPSSTCFCTQTGDGPQITENADLVLSEMDDGFIVQAMTETAAKLTQSLPLEKVALHQQHEWEIEIRNCISQMQSQIPDKESLYSLKDNRHAEQWDDIAHRCLSCGNCTSVCPTCFCSKHTLESSSEGTTETQVRLWDSCFTEDHSYLHGHPVRNNIKSRYQQWLTHKFSFWQDQYGRSGCTGCGRCITWCPVGIDIRVELNRLVESQ